jgi:hypothetical protein
VASIYIVAVFPLYVRLIQSVAVFCAKVSKVLELVREDVPAHKPPVVVLKMPDVVVILFVVAVILPFEEMPEFANKVPPEVTEPVLVDMLPEVVVILLVVVLIGPDVIEPITVKLVKLPTDVILGCATVIMVPIKPTDDAIVPTTEMAELMFNVPVRSRYKFENLGVI